MSLNYPISLHIFRRDLRLQDNTSLIAALKSSKRVIPCFIFDERQIKDNDYKSNHCLQFMCQSLRELDIELKHNHSHLYCFYGISEEIVKQLIKKVGIKAVFINRDYTPFSIKRDKNIAKICQELNISFHAYADALLQEPEVVHRPNNQPYQVFTHFLNNAAQFPVTAPQRNVHPHYYEQPISFENHKILHQLLKRVHVSTYFQGGRKEALALLKNIKNFSNYHLIRNFPFLSGTTKLSPHNKFGTLSIRELYAEILKYFTPHHSLITELYWRDFFTHIAFHYPHVFGEPFHQRYKHLHWSQNKAHFEAWCTGTTGFPIVDAGMRELNTTGFMHNRVRMIVASFLTKDLHIDWRWGEKYFAQQLIDYDPAVNNGNWQWSASTGCDAQPYFRIFNPWLQQKKYDPDCLYIKQWVQELAEVPSKTIHKLNEISYPHYLAPVVNHSIEAEKAKLMYKLI